MIDVAKGIGIILVVIGHTNLPLVAMNLIYAFHVPLFFVLSGMVFNMNKNLTELFINKFKTLLVPYYFFGIFVTLALYLQPAPFDFFRVIDFAIFGTGYNSALWFIAHLFVLSIYAYFWLLVKSKKILYFILIMHLLIGLKFLDIALPAAWSFNLLPLSFSFFMIGYLLGDFLINMASSLKSWVVLLIVLIFLSSVYFNIDYHGYSTDSYGRFLDMPINYVIAVLCGILITLYLSEKLKNIKFFQFVGRHTIVILSTHQAIPMILTSLYLAIQLDIPSVAHRMLSLSLILLIIVFIDRYAKFLIGRK